jgi:hypothetical protein
MFSYLNVSREILCFEISGGHDHNATACVELIRATGNFMT